MRVLLTAPDLPDPAMAALRARAEVLTLPIPSPPERIEALLRETPVDGILSRTSRLTGAAIGQARGLRAISKHGTGVDNIDVDAATARGVPVLFCFGANARSVAEHALAMILALARNLVTHDAAMRRGEWPRFLHHGTELEGRRLGLVGYGESARHLAGMALGLGLRVAAHGRSIAARPVPEGVERCPDLGALLQASDIVSLHCPLTPQTRHLIGAAAFARMKPGAWLINVARGEVVEEAALLDALASGRLGAAGLDCFAREPLPPDHPLRAMPNVVLTPHLAGGSAQAALRVADMAVRNLLAALDGGPVDRRCLANPEVLDRLTAPLRLLDSAP